MVTERHDDSELSMTVVWAVPTEHVEAVGEHLDAISRIMGKDPGFAELGQLTRYLGAGLGRRAQLIITVDEAPDGY
jgi:hypothetical protein